MSLHTVPKEKTEEPAPGKSPGEGGSPERTFWGRGGTHRDKGLTDAGEQVWPQRVD